MSYWFRHYTSLSRDEKLVSVAIKSKQSIERVVWVWCAILESAATINDSGRYNLDIAEVSYFLRVEEKDIQTILHALKEAGRVKKGTVVKWGQRQFQSDRSSERTALYRRRKRSEGVLQNGNTPSRNGDVTSQERFGDAPDSDSDSDSETEKRTASQRSDTRQESHAAGTGGAPIKKQPKPPDRNRGTRLPEGWQPGNDWLEFTRSEGLTDDVAKRGLEEFIDYWRGVAGAKGVKLDWLATWRNRVRQLSTRSQHKALSPQTGRGRPESTSTLGAYQRAANRFRRETDLS